MFEDALKGTKIHRGGIKVKSGKIDGMRIKSGKVFGSKDASRWKKEGNVSTMMKFRKPKNW